MEEIINHIKSFIAFDLSPTVRFLIVGLLAIFGILSFVNIIKGAYNAKSISSKIIFPIIFTIIFIGLAIFVATA